MLFLAIFRAVTQVVFWYYLLRLSRLSVTLEVANPSHTVAVVKTYEIVEINKKGGWSRLHRCKLKYNQGRGWLFHYR